MIESLMEIIDKLILYTVYGIGLIWGVAGAINAIKDGFSGRINIVMFVSCLLIAYLFYKALINA